MKSIFLIAAALLTLIISLSGCSGGDGTFAEPPKTSGATTLYLFGAMSSSSKVVSIHTEITVPDGIMVNYSSPPGVTTGKYPLHSGSIVPSGPVKFPQDIFQKAEYNLSDRKLILDFFNTPDLTGNRVTNNIRSGTSGNGVEVATLYFKLKTADVLPTLPTPWDDSSALIGVDFNSSPANIMYPSGLKLNFVTSFLP